MVFLLSFKKKQKTIKKMGNIVAIVLIVLAIAVAVVAALTFVYHWPLWSQIVSIVLSLLLLGFGIGCFYWNKPVR